MFFRGKQPSKDGRLPLRFVVYIKGNCRKKDKSFDNLGTVGPNTKKHQTVIKDCHDKPSDHRCPYRANPA